MTWDGGYDSVWSTKVTDVAALLPLLQRNIELNQLLGWVDFLRCWQAPKDQQLVDMFEIWLESGDLQKQAIFEEYVFIYVGVWLLSIVFLHIIVTKSTPLKTNIELNIWRFVDVKYSLSKGVFSGSMLVFRGASTSPGFFGAWLSLSPVFLVSFFGGWGFRRVQACWAVKTCLPNFAKACLRQGVDQTYATSASLKIGMLEFRNTSPFQS